MFQLQHRAARLLHPSLPAILVAALVLGVLLSGPVKADSGNQIFIPLLMTEPACEPSAEEAQLENLLRSVPEQTRDRVECDVVLSAVARERAKDMAQRHYFGHVNPDGVGPNQLVRNAGYPLPDYYTPSQDGNNIESIAGGYSSAQAAWAGLMESPGHRRHLVGEIDFYREQTDVGIGYYYDAQSDYQHYWVIITAKPAD